MIQCLVEDHAWSCIYPGLLCLVEFWCFSCGSSESHLWISGSVCSKDGKTNCGIGFWVCGDVIVLHVAVTYRNTQLSLSCSYSPLHTDGLTPTAENQYHEEFWLRSTCWSSVSVCAPVETSLVFHLSAGSPVTRCDLPVTVPQEATALDYNVQGWTLCTLEPGGRVFCRVCIISL